MEWWQILLVVLAVLFAVLLITLLVVQMLTRRNPDIGKAKSELRVPNGLETDGRTAFYYPSLPAQPIVTFSEADPEGFVEVDLSASSPN